MKHRRINLLPLELRTEVSMELTSWIRRLTVIAVVLMVALTIFNLMQVKITAGILSRQQAGLVKLIEEQQKLTPLAERLLWLKKRMAGLNQSKQVLDDINRREFFRWSETLQHLAWQTSEGMRLSAVTFSQTNEGDAMVRRFQLGGKSNGFFPVASFTTVLELDPKYENIIFYSAERGASGSVDFSVSGSIKR